MGKPAYTMMEPAERRAQQIACIEHDLETIRTYARRVNTIIELEHLDIPPIELPQLAVLDARIDAAKVAA